MNPFLARFVDDDDEGSLSVSMRKRRIAIFLRLVDQFLPPVNILDAGGTENFWRTMGVAHDPRLRITLLNDHDVATTLPNFSSVTGDARNMDGFRSGEFDVVFSNSVIEHVGDFDDQKAMASEIQRVGRTYFVQTPSKHFPIEPHFLVPGFQFLPLSLRVALIRRFDLGWYQRIPDAEKAREHVLSHRLLTRREMKRLFPSATILSEGFLGLTKSLIARGGSPPPLPERRRPPSPHRPEAERTGGQIG